MISSEIVHPEMTAQASVHAYAAHEAGKPLDAFSYEPLELGPWDVEIAITHCGICHTDLHLIDNDVGISIYPLVPGQSSPALSQHVAPPSPRFRLVSASELVGNQAPAWSVSGA